MMLGKPDIHIQKTETLYFQIMYLIKDLSQRYKPSKNNKKKTQLKK
jgi:hypothetical protein